MKLEKKHWIWIGLGVAALTIAGVLVYQKRKKTAEKKLQEDKSNETNSNFSVEKKASEEKVTPNQLEQKIVFPLKNGSTGFEVAVVQEYMNSTCKESIEKSKIFEYPIDLTGSWDDEMDLLCEECSSLKRKEISEDKYNQIYRDMKAANLIPEKV